jgi:uncharacterized membrane protein YbhN (UPF0104 family)
LLGLGLLGLWFDAELRQTPIGWMSGIMLLIGLLVAVPFVSPRATQAIHHLATPILHLPLPTLIQHQVQRVWHALLLFQQLPRLTPLWVILLSLLLHIIGVWRMGLAAQAVGIQQPVLVLTWVYIIVYTSNLVPIAIAGLGVRDVTMVVLLSRYGVPEAQALSMSLLLFSVIVIVGLLGGLVEAWSVWQNTRKTALDSRPLSSHHIDKPVE